VRIGISIRLSLRFRGDCFSMRRERRICTSPDAWIAAAVKVTSSRLVTFDRGFRRLLGKGEVLLLTPLD
jgi:predicted nucleic acid-binding protein